MKNYKIAKNISHPIVKRAEGLSNEVSNSSVRFRAKNEIQDSISDSMNYDWFLSGICPLGCCDEYRFSLGLELK